MGDHWMDIELSLQEQNTLAKSLGGDFFASPSMSKSYDESYRTIEI